MSILERVYNYVTGRFIKSVNYQTIFGAGNIEGGGGGGVSKEYVDEQDEALSERIDENANDIQTQQDNLNNLSTRVSNIGGAVENLENDKADKTETYTKTETDNLLNNKADKSTTYTKSEIDTELNKKLNLSGGSMTGTITQSAETAIKQSAASKQIVVYGGTSISDGATLALRGKNRTSEQGTFLLNASNGTNTKTLQGYPNGILTWDGKTIVVNDGTYTGDNVMTISNIASQGLSNGADYASNVTRRIIKVGNMVFFTCHIKWTSIAVGNAWTTVGTMASKFKPNFNRPTIVGMVYNNGENEACGGNVDTTGVIQVWTNAKTAGNNYQIRLSGFWTVD